MAVAREVIETFVDYWFWKHYGVAEREPQPNVKMKILRSDSFQSVRDKSFRFVRSFRGFDRVNKGETIATDETGPICFEGEGSAYLLMPTQLPFTGEEAWFWAFEEPSAEAMAMSGPKRV